MRTVKDEWKSWRASLLITQEEDHRRLKSTFYAGVGSALMLVQKIMTKEGMAPKQRKRAMENLHEEVREFINKEIEAFDKRTKEGSNDRRSDLRLLRGGKGTVPER